VRHLKETRIGEKEASAVAGNHHTLLQRFEDVLHLEKPFWVLNVYEIPFRDT
jgi:hypothetical protein